MGNCVGSNHYGDVVHSSETFGKHNVAAAQLMEDSALQGVRTPTAPSSPRHQVVLQGKVLSRSGNLRHPRDEKQASATDSHRTMSPHTPTLPTFHPLIRPDDEDGTIGSVSNHHKRTNNVSQMGSEANDLTRCDSNSGKTANQSQATMKELDSETGNPLWRPLHTQQQFLDFSVAMAVSVNPETDDDAPQQNICGLVNEMRPCAQTPARASIVPVAEVEGERAPPAAGESPALLSRPIVQHHHTTTVIITNVPPSVTSPFRELQLPLTDDGQPPGSGKPPAGAAAPHSPPRWVQCNSQPRPPRVPHAPQAIHSRPGRHGSKPIFANITAVGGSAGIKANTAADQPRHPAQAQQASAATPLGTPFEAASEYLLFSDNVDLQQQERLWEQSVHERIDGRNWTINGSWQLSTSTAQKEMH